MNLLLAATSLVPLIEAHRSFIGFAQNEEEGIFAFLTARHGGIWVGGPTASRCGRVKGACRACEYASFISSNTTLNMSVLIAGGQQGETSARLPTSCARFLTALSVFAGPYGEINYTSSSSSYMPRGSSTDYFRKGRYNLTWGGGPFYACRQSHGLKVYAPFVDITRGVDGKCISFDWMISPPGNFMAHEYI